MTYVSIAFMVISLLSQGAFNGSSFISFGSSFGDALSSHTSHQEEPLNPDLPSVEVIPYVTYLIVITVFILGFYVFYVFYGQLRRDETPGQVPTNKQRLDEVLEKIRKMPIAHFHSKEYLQSCSVKTLKKILGGLNIDMGKFQNCVEFQNLVQLVIDETSSGIGSTADSCSICIDDYDRDDLLRVFPCGHRFHLECADRWAISSQSSIPLQLPPGQERPKFKCPMCNKVV